MGSTGPILHCYATLATFTVPTCRFAADRKSKIQNRKSCSLPASSPPIPNPKPAIQNRKSGVATRPLPSAANRQSEWELRYAAQRVIRNSHGPHPTQAAGALTSVARPDCNAPFLDFPVPCIYTPTCGTSNPQPTGPTRDERESQVVRPRISSTRRHARNTVTHTHPRCIARQVATRVASTAVHDARSGAWAGPASLLLTGIVLVITGIGSICDADAMRKEGDSTGEALRQLQGRVGSVVAEFQARGRSADPDTRVSLASESAFAKADTHRVRREFGLAIALYRMAHHADTNNAYAYLYRGLATAESALITKDHVAAVSLFMQADTAYDYALQKPERLDTRAWITALQWSNWNTVNKADVTSKIDRLRMRQRQERSGWMVVIIGGIQTLCGVVAVWPRRWRFSRPRLA
jgi:hypothetical protein